MLRKPYFFPQNYICTSERKYSIFHHQTCKLQCFGLEFFVDHFCHISKVPFYYNESFCPEWLFESTAFSVFIEMNGSKWSHSVISDSATPWTAAFPGSSVHGMFQARALEWVAISFVFFSFFPISVMNYIDYFILFFGCTIWHVGSQFPAGDQTRGPWSGDEES